VQQNFLQLSSICLLLTVHFYYEMVEMVLGDFMQLTGVMLLSDMQLTDMHCTIFAAMIQLQYATPFPPMFMIYL
jgi:hypothetical protein